MKKLAEKRNINWKLKYFFLREWVFIILGLLAVTAGIIVLIMRGII